MIKQKPLKTRAFAGRWGFQTSVIKRDRDENPGRGDKALPYNATAD